MSTRRPPTLLASSNKSAQRACRMFETIPQHPPAVSKQMSKKKALLKMLICPLELTSKMSHPFSLGKGQNCYPGQRPRMDTRARKKPGTMEEGLKCNPTVTLTTTQSGSWWGRGGVCVWNLWLVARMKVICWKLYQPVIRSCLSTQHCKYLSWRKYPSSDEKFHGLPNYHLKGKFNSIYYLFFKGHD